METDILNNRKYGLLVRTVQTKDILRTFKTAFSNFDKIQGLDKTKDQEVYLEILRSSITHTDIESIFFNFSQSVKPRDLAVIVNPETIFGKNLFAAISTSDLSSNHQLKWSEKQENNPELQLEKAIENLKTIKATDNSEVIIYGFPKDAFVGFLVNSRLGDSTNLKNYHSFDEETTKALDKTFEWLKNNGINEVRFYQYHYEDKKAKIIELFTEHMS